MVSRRQINPTTFAYDFDPDTGGLAPVEVVVGDIRDPNNFLPDVSFGRWGDCEVRVGIPDLDNGLKILDTSDPTRLRLTSQDYHLDFHPRADDATFAADIVFFSRPQSMTVSFPVQSTGVSWLRQGELTAQQIADGDERPDNVINSYALYRTDGRRNNATGGASYFTGKLAHVFRPKLIDAALQETWAEMLLSPDGTVLEVTLPRQWMNQATYPVTLDPDFGYTTAGGSGNDVENDIRATEATLTEAGTVTSMSASISLTNNAKDGQFGVYAYVAQQNAGAQEFTTSTVNYAVGAQRWETQSGLSESLSAATYFLCFNGDLGGGNFLVYYDDGGGANTGIGEAGAGFPGWTDPWTTETGVDRIFSIYATYTATGAEEPPRTLTVTGAGV